MKNFLINGMKILVVGGLIYWLASNGKLDFRQLSILIEQPITLVAAILVWLVASLFLGSLRWNLLLKGMGITIPLYRTMRLQVIGFFFNTAMPGAVGGDVIKGIYVMREKTANSRTNALLTIILDRIIGLVAIFAIAAVAILSRWDIVRGNAGLTSIAIFVGAGVVAITLVGILCLSNLFEGRDPLKRLFSLRIPGFSIILKVYNALLLFRKDPGTIGKAFLISVIAQVMSLLFGYLLAVTLTSQHIDILVYSLVHPIGILTTALPLAPGGLGVGHIAFDRLFVMAGFQGGANVFNVMVLSQLALNLTGVIPYFLHKSEIDELEKEIPSSAGFLNKNVDN